MSTGPVLRDGDFGLLSLRMLLTQSCRKRGLNNFRSCICIFLVNMEVTITSTSLVAIADDLNDFELTNWIVSGYLITYTSAVACFDALNHANHKEGCIIIWAKLSDVLGRKLCLLTSMFIFTVFSAGCGATQSIVQL